MRAMLAALTLAFGMVGMAGGALASIYVPGHIRDGIYIRPHFIAAPKAEYGIWSDEHVGEPQAGQKQPPLLDRTPVQPNRNKLGEPS